MTRLRILALVHDHLAYGEDVAESAEVSGLSYERLLDRILALGLRWEPART